MAKQKKSINELRGDEVLQLKKELKISPGGVIQAEQVVKAARNEKKYPSLHSRFDWDDTKAAHLHRLWQAREMFVEVRRSGGGKKNLPVPRDTHQGLPDFVSLKRDQKQPGGGYRETVEVMSDDELRAELLSQVWDEFEYLRRKYNELKELADIFIAVDRAKEKAKMKPRPKRIVRKKEEPVLV